MFFVKVLGEILCPEGFFDRDVEISFHHVESRYDVQCLLELGANFVGDHVGCFACEFDVGEYHDGAVAGELFAGWLDEFGVGVYVDLIEAF